MPSEEKQSSWETQIAGILVQLLRSQASDHRTSATLWSTDPEKYGADELSIKEWTGKAQGLEDAADLVEQFLS